MAENCEDKKCFQHGEIKVRGERLEGIVVSAKSKRTIVVERDAVKYFSKYQKWARGRSRIAAHNPPCIDAKVGDLVILGECRKLSKTKAWTVIQKTSGESS